MTGQGQARRQSDGLLVSAEIRSVNNRFLKVSVTCSERAAELESKIKSLVQDSIRRGSVYVQLDLQREDQSSAYKIDTGVLRSYLEQLSQLDSPVAIGDCLMLPGVVSEQPSSIDTESVWPEVRPAIEEALAGLIEMRRLEGESMASDLRSQCGQIRELLGEIRSRAPQVAKDYSERLTERINTLLAELDLSISAGDVVKEVGVFADRCDISEEMVRLQTHLDQFESNVNSSQSDGRKLEFLTQEMLRETNTIGSKANDAEIARHVVDIKTAIERIREMTQNIE